MNESCHHLFYKTKTTSSENCFSTDLEAMTDCNLCDPGYYCDTQGLLLPRAQCDPGYLCYSGAITSGPTDGVTGELCPAGGYCVAGKEEN